MLPPMDYRMMPTVLVVDDSPVDRRLVGGLLAKAPNIEIVYAGDGDEALELMGKACPTVVLTDMIMPNMDGLELTAEVNKRYPLVPVILMTGWRCAADGRPSRGRTSGKDPPAGDCRGRMSADSVS